MIYPPVKLLLLFIITTASVWSINAQSAQKFNLDLEEQGNDASLSKGWHKWGDYAVGTENAIVYSGETSGWIASGNNGSAFGSIAYRLPAHYRGSEIKLEGYMKTEGVADGFAGLLLRIDGSAGALEFDNMQGQNITGTTDWKKYSISLPYPQGAENIFLGGLLVGKGKIWLDAFKLTIDGKDVQSLGTKEKPVLKANPDREYNAGSGFNFPELNNHLVEDLALLGKVWGFLKYHHPEIARGNCNWDTELFRILPGYISTADPSARDQFLVNWIDTLGEIRECENCTSTGKNLYKKPDHSWMKDKQIGSSLREKLEQVHKGRNSEEHFYIGFDSNVNNPVFKNEEAYANMPYPGEELRLLALFRYWNIIEYFFPNKHLIGKDWDAVLKAYIPVFIHAKNELEYEIAAVKMIGEIHDTHANLWGGGDKFNDWKGSYFAPVRVDFVEDQLVVTEYYNPELKEAGDPEVGDVITRIGGTPVELIVDSLEAYYPASNQPTRLRNISADLLRSRKDKVSINFISEHGEQQKDLQLYGRDRLNMYGFFRTDEQTYRCIDDNIGYITLASIEKNDIAEIKEDFRDTEGIIIDIRNYPSTFVPFSLGSWFVTRETPFVRFSNGSLRNPGEFTMTAPVTLNNPSKAYEGKVVVLLNEVTQSQAEYTAMAFRAGANTTIVGSTTAGADGNISEILLPGGLRTLISGIGVYYPDGRETQRVGIVPDVEVKPSIRGIREGRDELLEKAVEIIKKGKQDRG